MKKVMILLAVLMLPLIVNVQADTTHVELPFDNDPYQYWTFENCDPDSFTNVAWRLSMASWPGKRPGRQSGFPGRTPSGSMIPTASRWS